MTRAATTPADPVRALEGATSYWASVVAGPPRHMSRNGAQGTNTMMITLGRSARLVSLHQGRPDIADGTGYDGGEQHWPRTASGIQGHRRGRPPTPAIPKCQVLPQFACRGVVVLGRDEHIGGTLPLAESRTCPSTS